MIKNRIAIIGLLTGLNLLNYIDRAVLSAVLPSIEKEFRLSHFESGLLATAFLLGYFITSPWFAARANQGTSRKHLIAFGVLVWSVATIASGLSTGLVSLIIARVVVGVGEASFATLGPTIIDDITPPDRKGKALSFFYLALPVGYALGYLSGGFIGEHWGWRSAMYVAGIPGILLAIVCLAIVEPARTALVAKEKVLDGLRALARIPLFRRATLGYILFTAALGAFAYFAPTFLTEKFPKNPVTKEGLDLAGANFWFGLTTILGGAVGTMIGGRWADASQRGLPAIPVDADAWNSKENRIGANALLKICALGMCLATPLALVAYFMPTPMTFFIVVFFIQVGLFVGTSPINAIFLRVVPNHLRAMAMAGSIFAIHMFGDLWSPPTLGAIVDGAGQLAGMAALSVAFAGALFAWWPRAKEAL